MCRGVSGELLASCRRRASALSNCIATVECRAAMRSTQCIVGELSLKRATCASVRLSHTVSMTNQRSMRPAISKSEFVSRPVGFEVETTSFLMSGGHSKRKTVGGIALFSPMMMPPTPCLEASLIPTKSGHALTRALHFVGARIDSWRKILHSVSAVMSF